MSLVPQGLLRLLRWLTTNVDIVVALMLLLLSPFLQWEIPIRKFSATVFGVLLQILIRILKPIVKVVSWNVILRRRRRPSKEYPLRAIDHRQLCIALDKVQYTRAVSIF